MLQNKLFISTRPQGQSDELKRLFEAEGAQLLELPLIRIKPLELSKDDSLIFDTLNRFDWLILTSPNGVRSFFESLKEKGIDSLTAGIQIGVIGKKTQKVLNTFGYKPAFVNPGNTAEEFVAAFIPKIQNCSEKPQILLALGNLARTVIQDELKEYATCTRINVYETVMPDYTDEKTLQLIRENRYEMLIFTSPSTIQNFMKLHLNIPAEDVRIACIGDITAHEAKNRGITPLVVAEDASAQGIVDAIIHYYSKKLKKL
ncbi:uroporphyrinogen-III synthase [Maribellus sediminis]|uniref:uroporphyrinogen-III synthase n=1 Tax=Maribellus sediminis TaxID=2696285 RepID=UPI001430A6EA|nr:uroporphyrinogen-III synthase [Maribellus sediminis]